MSQSAKKRPTPPTEPSVRDENGSGRYVIGPDRRVATVLPPRNAEADEVLSLDAVGGLELAAETIDPTPPALPNTVSGVFASGQGPRESGELDAIANGIASMRPYYTDSEQKSERVDLLVEDLSLRFDNPYAASSLVPPPRKPLPVGKILGVAAALIALGSGAWFATQRIEQAQPETAVNAVVAAPHHVAAPVAAASVVKPAAAQVVAAVATPAATPATVATTVAPVHAPITSATHERVQAALPRRANDAASAALSAVLKDAASPANVSAVPAAPAAPVAAAAAAEAAPVEALGALPDLPSREQVVAGFEHTRAAIDTCAAGKHGKLTIDATIANSGRVAQALIGGVFAGTPEGSCIARAVRSTRFPAFSQPSLKVSYPIAL